MKKWTDEERAAFGAKMRAAKLAKQNPVVPEDGAEEDVTQVEDKPDLSAMQAQMNEIMETNALLKAALLRGDKKDVSIQNGQVTGVVEKYRIDKEYYPDPSERLSKEPKLVQAVNFPFNYELTYEFNLPAPYPTKSGIMQQEPEFRLRLLRVDINDQGEQTNKRFVVKKFVFHEDPQAAEIIARENGVDLSDQEDRKTFLDEMRYLRCRDWVFDIFWPTPATPKEEMREEVVAGTLMEVITKSSVEPTGIDFDKITKKIPKNI